MKKLALITFPVLLLLVSSCGRQADINTLLQNQDTRNQIFTKIADDHELMTAFMEKMMSSNHAKMMMQGNKNMMGMMMNDVGMMQIMKDNPYMMHTTMSHMMKDGQMMAHMMQMMKQEGIMSEEAMQSCMKMMADKGMDMGGMKDMKKDGNHESHHSKQ